MCCFPTYLHVYPVNMLSWKKAWRNRRNVTYMYLQKFQFYDTCRICVYQVLAHLYDYFSYLFSSQYLPVVMSTRLSNYSWRVRPSPLRGLETNPNHFILSLPKSKHNWKRKGWQVSSAHAHTAHTILLVLLLNWLLELRNVPLLQLQYILYVYMYIRPTKLVLLVLFFLLFFPQIIAVRHTNEFVWLNKRFRQLPCAKERIHFMWTLLEHSEIVDTSSKDCSRYSTHDLYIYMFV